MSAIIFRGGRFLGESGKRVQVEEILGQTGTKAKAELDGVPLFSGVKDDFFWTKMGELFKTYKATAAVFAPGVLKALFDLLTNVKLPMTNSASDEVKLRTSNYDTARLLQMLERLNILIPKTIKANEALKSGTVSKSERADLEKNPDKSVIGYVLHKHFADRLGGLLRTFDIDVNAVPALALATESRGIKSANSRGLLESWQDEDAIVADLVKFFAKKDNITDDEKLAEIHTEISESLDLERGRYSSFGECGSFKYDGTEYNLIPDVDVAEEIAVDYVTQSLEDEPEIFNQDFLGEYVYVGDTDKRIMAGEEADSYMDGIDDEDAIKQADMEDEYEAASDDEKDAVVEKAKDKIREERYEYVYKFLDKDPIGYLVDELGAYTREEAVKQPFISIDHDKAAQAAVDTDGWEHFLSLYDGNYEETNGGLVIFRED